jgi:hypothetical protein
MLKLKNLLEDAKTAEPTESKYLDGRYFNLVLKEYEGKVEDPVVFRVERVPEFINSKGFPRNAIVREVSAPISINLSDKAPDFLRLVIEVMNADGGLKTRHSNLLILIPNIPDHIVEEYKGTAYRFEPLNEPEFYHDINDALEKYLGTIGYDLKIVDSHPQGLGEDRGMCMAYVLKYAVMYVTGNERKFYEDTSDIRRFAGAVEDNYVLPKGTPDKEFGAGTGAFIGGVSGGLVGCLAGPVGCVAGAAFGAGGGAVVGALT